MHQTPRLSGHFWERTEYLAKRPVDDVTHFSSAWKMMFYAVVSASCYSLTLGMLHVKTTV